MYVMRRAKLVTLRGVPKDALKSAGLLVAIVECIAV